VKVDIFTVSPSRCDLSCSNGYAVGNAAFMPNLIDRNYLRTHGLAPLTKRDSPAGVKILRGQSRIARANQNPGIRFPFKTYLQILRTQFPQPIPRRLLKIASPKASAITIQNSPLVDSTGKNKWRTSNPFGRAK
jgi:hypothetical protein